MSIKYEEVEFCKVRLEYFAPVETVEQKREQALEEIFKESKNMTLKGFRKGTAGLDAVKMRFRKEIDESIKQKLIGQALEDYTFETHAKTVFYPEIKTAQLKNNHFECSMIVLKKPDFELKQYKDFEIPKPHVEQSSLEMIEKALQEIRVSNGDVKPYGADDFVQIGDKVTLDMKCEAQGKVVEEFTKDGLLYEVGSGLYQDVDDNIQGMTAGEKRTFETVWDPETKEMAKFTIFVHMGIKNVPAALDDELAKKIGFESFDKLRSHLEGQVSSSVTEQETREIKQQIMQRLLDEHQFEVPTFLLDLQAQEICTKFGAQLSTLDADQKKKIYDRSKDMIKLSMIVDSIRQKEPETLFSEREVVEHIRNQLVISGQDSDKFLAENLKSGKLTGIVASLQDEAVFEWLIKNSKIVD